MTTKNAEILYEVNTNIIMEVSTQIDLPDIEENWPEEEELNGWVSEDDSDENEEIEQEDWEILGMQSNVLSSLVWKENADKSLKSKYLGIAGSSLYRKKQKDCIHEQHCQNNLRLTAMGFTVMPLVSKSTVEEPIAISSREQMQTALNNVSSNLDKWKCGTITLDKFDLLRYQSIKLFLSKLLNGGKKMESAISVAKDI